MINFHHKITNQKLSNNLPNKSNKPNSLPTQNILKFNNIELFQIRQRTKSPNFYTKNLTSPFFWVLKPKSLKSIFRILYLIVYNI